MRSSFAPSSLPSTAAHGGAGAGSDWGGAASTVGHHTATTSDFHTAAGSNNNHYQWGVMTGAPPPPSDHASSQWLESEIDIGGGSQWDELSTTSHTLMDDDFNDSRTLNNNQPPWDELSSVHTLLESSHMDTLSGVPTIVETNSQWDAVSVSTLHRLSSNFGDEDDYSEDSCGHSTSSSTSDYSDDELSQVWLKHESAVLDFCPLVFLFLINDQQTIEYIVLMYGDIDLTSCFV